MQPIRWDDIADLYDDYVQQDCDVPFWRDIARGANGEVLELMAGTGRVSLPLLRDGIRLVCVDAAAGMLARLEEKAAAAGLAVTTVHAEVRDLPFEDRFPLAILPFHSFSELLTVDDQRAALASIRRSLVPGGRIVLSLHEPERRRRAIDGRLRSTGRFACGEGTLCLFACETWDAAREVVEGAQFYELYGPDGVLRSKRVLETRFRLPGLEEIERLAVETGFDVVETWGDYDGSPLRPGESPFVIASLARAGDPTLPFATDKAPRS